MIITKIDAIHSLAPTARVISVDNVVTWINPSTPSVTDAQINAEVARLQAEYDSKEYQRQRAAEYPSIQEQLDTLYHGGLTEWKASIKAIKDKYPKE